MNTDLDHFESNADEPHAYLTTTGRRSGSSHEIEIWWAYANSRIYMISGGGDSSDWVRNLQADPSASIRVRDHTIDATARFELGDDEREDAGRRLAQKYRPGQGSWSDGFLVAFDAPGAR